MIRVTDKSQCCGCSACYAVCPHDAISMKKDPLGFRYPQVDHELCVECGLCEKVCSFTSEIPENLPTALAVRHKDDKEVARSTSGAAFVALSDHVLENEGTVYGAAFGPDFQVHHKRAENSLQRDEFRKSKYVQSDMGDVFRQVRNDLKQGRTVLFSGTPCQTAGLKSFIGKSLADNLFLVDIVCHGVPAPGVWEAYLDQVKRNNTGNLKEVCFRDKSFGWRSSVETYLFDTGKKTSKSFNYLFYKNIILRDSCGICPYASVSRTSDITIADYWRDDKTCPDFASDGNGCSLVLCHSEKGRKLLDECADILNVEKVELNDCIQPNLKTPSVLHPDRFRFAEDFEQKGIEYVMKIYGDQGWRYKIRFIVSAAYRFVRRTVRSVLGKK